jgi:hypothetical protein
MEFRASGRTYRCPLYVFQPRTEVLPVAEVESAAKQSRLASSSR